MAFKKAKHVYQQIFPQRSHSHMKKNKCATSVFCSTVPHYWSAGTIPTNKKWTNAKNLSRGNKLLLNKLAWCVDVYLRQGWSCCPVQSLSRTRHGDRESIIRMQPSGQWCTILTCFFVPPDLEVLSWRKWGADSWDNMNLVSRPLDDLCSWSLYFCVVYRQGTCTYMNLEEQRLLGKSMQSSWSPIFQTGTGNRLKGELITERSKAEQKDWLPLRSCWHFSTNYLLFSIAGSLQCHARAWRPGRYGPARALGPGADIRPGDPFCWQALKEVQEAQEGGGGSSPATHCEARGRNSTGAHRCLELVHQGNSIANCTLLPDSFFFFFRGRKRSQASTWGTFWGSWVRTPLRMTSLQWWWRSVAHPWHFKR